MFETLVHANSALARHRNGPLVEERARYPRHCAALRGTFDSQRMRARCILWVAERMSPQDHGSVDGPRLHEIASVATPATAATVMNYARPWLTYMLRMHLAPLFSLQFAHQSVDSAMPVNHPIGNRIENATQHGDRSPSTRHHDPGRPPLDPSYRGRGNHFWSNRCLEWSGES